MVIFYFKYLQSSLTGLFLVDKVGFSLSLWGVIFEKPSLACRKKLEFSWSSAYAVERKI